VSVVVLAALLALGATACGVLPEPDFERMIDQRSYRAYEPAPKSMFADGRAMRPPPEGTISRDRVLGRPAFTAGVVDARYVEAPPVTVDRARLERGRDRFDVFCAACHGLRGDGVSTVARRMTLRKPPSLLVAPVTTFPAGRTFQVISEGYGLMPSYASEMSVDDRWNVVAYLRALTLSQSVPLDRLPSDLRARAEKELR
jgi:mono/diheme cytochrome c family protein